MAKKKKQKRKLTFASLSVITFFIAGTSFFFSSVFLRSYNNSLSSMKQSIENEIVLLESQNDALEVEIQTLKSPERVNAIASSNGMSLNQENIITIAAEGNESE